MEMNKSTCTLVASTFFSSVITGTNLHYAGGATQELGHPVPQVVLLVKHVFVKRLRSTYIPQFASQLQLLPWLRIPPLPSFSTYYERHLCYFHGIQEWDFTMRTASSFEGSSSFEASSCSVALFGSSFVVLRPNIPWKTALMSSLDSRSGKMVMIMQAPNPQAIATKTQKAK